MKYLIFLLFPFLLNSQSIECYKCASKTELNHSIISGNSFTGLIVKRPKKANVILYQPIQVTNKNKWFTLKDCYGTKVEIDITTFGPNLNTISKFYNFIENCFCVDERLLYVVDITKPSNSSEDEFILNERLNTTSLTFEFSESTIYAVCTPSNLEYLDKIKSITWYRSDGIGRNNVFYVNDQLGTINLPIINDTSLYRLSIEFYNY